MLQQKRGWLAVLFLLLVLLGSACQRTLPPPEPPDYRGVTLRVACPSGLGQLVAVQSRPWASRQQADVRVVEYDRKKGPAGTGADIWVIRPAELPRWAEAGRLAVVPESLVRRQERFDWGSLLPAYRTH